MLGVASMVVGFPGLLHRKNSGAFVVVLCATFILQDHPSNSGFFALVMCATFFACKSIRPPLLCTLSSLGLLVALCMALSCEAHAKDVSHQYNLDRLVLQRN